MAGGMGQAGMSSYYGPAYGSLSAASMAAAAAAAAQQSAAAMSAGLGAPAQVSPSSKFCQPYISNIWKYFRDLLIFWYKKIHSRIDNILVFN